MRIRNLEQLSEDYHPISEHLDPDDLIQRMKFVKNHPFSIILEGEYTELSNLITWIEKELEQSPEYIYYGKLAYDYGYVEYFLSNQADYEALKEVIPKIYTSYPSAKISKTDGIDGEILKDESDAQAIVFPLWKGSNL